MKLQHRREERGKSDGRMQTQRQKRISFGRLVTKRRRRAEDKKAENRMEETKIQREK